MNYNRPVRATVKTRSGSVNARKLAMLLAAMAASSQLAPTPVVAQAAATGVIQGRVMNAANGMYLNNARVTVEGTSIETFTNEFGDFTLNDVPAGPVSLRATYTGQEPQVTKVTVEGGKTISQNISFNADQSTTGEDGTIVLNEFVVASDRFKNAQELATNEERYSTNIKSVVSTDSLGFVPGGNVGEFVKFLPGVQVGYGGGTTVNPANASSISVRGFGPDQTSIMIDGIPVSSASGNLTREAGLDTLSINNASRVEVIKVATPDMAAESAGGSINLVTKSAFEYAKPTTTVSLYFTTNSTDTKLSKQQGPTDEKSFHTLPSVRVSVAIPFSEKLGVTLSVASDNQYSPSSSVKSTWQRAPLTYDNSFLGGSTTTPLTNAKGEEASLVNPYLGTVSVAEYAWTDYKQSGNLKLDWKPIQGLVITSNANYSAYQGYSTRRNLQLQANRPMDWGSDYTIGRQSAIVDYNTTPPTLKIYDGGAAGNSAKMTVESFDKIGDTVAAYLKAGYNKGPFSLDGLASYSVSNLQYEDIKNGHFSTLDLTLNNVSQIRFDGVSNGVPALTTIIDRNGAVVDHTSIAGWGNSTADAGINDNQSRDTKTLYNLNARYQLDFLPFDLAVKTGFQRNELEQEKWGKGGTKYRYTGGTANPLQATQLLDPNGKRSPGYGLPAQEWSSVYTLYKLFQENPGLFDPNADIGLQASNLRSQLQNQKDIKETSDAYYGMLESKLFNNRLNLIVGARQTTRKRVGKDGAVDTKWNYVKNPDGSLYKDAWYRDGVKIDYSNAVEYDPNNPNLPGTTINNFDYTNEATGLMARLAAAGALHPGHVLKDPTGTSQANSSNNLEAVRLAYGGPSGQRTITAEAKDPVVPQVQASYKITDSLTLKGAWSHEVSLPNLEGTAGLLAVKDAFSINEYVGQQALDNPGVTGQIKLSNANLKPQETTSWNFELGYYTQNGGKISVSYYYKQIENIWENVTVPNSDSSYDLLLQSIGLSSANYPNYNVTSTVNGAENTKNTGYEVDIRQNLGFLGNIGKHFNMFATYSHKDIKQSTTSGSTVQVIAPSADDTYSGGLMFSTSRLSIAVRGIYVAENLQKNATKYTYNGVQVETYDYTPEEYKINVQLDYTISKRYSFFISGTNVLNDDRKSQFIDAAYVTPAYASTSGVSTFGVTINTGINAKF